MQLLLRVFSHSPVFLSRLSLCRFLCCKPLCPQLPRYPSVWCPGVLLAFRLPFPSQLSGIQFLLRRVLASIVLLSSPCREVIRGFILLCHSINRVVVPRVPCFVVVVAESLVGLPPWPGDVVQLRLSFPFSPNSGCVKGHVFLLATIGPHGSDLAIKLLQNSRPHQLLENTVISARCRRLMATRARRKSRSQRVKRSLLVARCLGEASVPKAQLLHPKLRFRLRIRPSIGRPRCRHSFIDHSVPIDPPRYRRDTLARTVSDDDLPSWRR